MKDVLLLTAIATAEGIPEMQTEITLVSGGFLISGVIVSYENYMKHHPLTEAFISALTDIEKSETDTQDGQEESSKLERNYIHLKDAKYFTPGQQPIPGNMGLYCRVSLESVAAFSFGRLVAEAR